MTGEAAVWVPAGRRQTLIRRGAGVVSTVAPRGDRVVVDFEGNVYGAAGMEVYADRVFHAWDRQVARYPTVARASLRAGDLARVATFDPDEGAVDVEEPDVLAAWLGAPTIDPAQLVCTTGRYAVRRAYRSALAGCRDPFRRHELQKMARRQGVSL